MIFLGQERRLVAIDHARKSFVEIDENVVVGMDERMKNAMGRAHEQARKLPPGQREAMEQRLSERMAASRLQPPASIEVRRTDERDTLDGRPATKHVVFRDGEKIREVWTTPWSGIEGGEELRPAFAELVSFVDELQTVVDRLLTSAGGSLSIASGPFAAMERMDGFPVLATSFEEGREVLRTVFTSSRRLALDPSTFEPPEGYRSRIVRDR